MQNTLKWFKVNSMKPNPKKIPSTHSKRYGTNSIVFRACLVWNKLPLSVKQSQSLIEFKSKIKALKK